MQELTPNNGVRARRSASTSQPTPINNRVFISYAREDEAFVLRLASALQARGIPIWLDQWHISPGADWDRTIDRALRESSKVVAVLSPEAVASPQVRAEIQSAVNEEKAVFPVLYLDCDVPRILRLYHFSDFRDSRNFEPELVRLAEALGAETLGDDTDARKPPPKPPEPPPSEWPSWRSSVKKFGRLMQRRRLLLVATIGAAVNSVILIVLAVGYVGPPSAPTMVVNPEERRPEIRPLQQTGNLDTSGNARASQGWRAEERFWRFRSW